MTEPRSHTAHSPSSDSPSADSPSDQAGDAMQVGSALAVLAKYRRPDQVVITNQGSAREWPKVSSHELDFHYIPSAMGGAIPLALGIALAQPRRHVMVLSGDGSLLMNLGCLVTVAGSGATNLSIIVLDNGVYEITGGQKTPGPATGVDFAGLARASGLSNVAHYKSLASWEAGAESVFSRPGPQAVWLQVQPVRENYELRPPCPVLEQLSRFRAALGG